MLKIVALISMLIDHVGYGFFPGEFIYRLIGRLAFPIFALYVGQGLRLTSNITNYKNRLFITAILASPFHYLYIGNNLLNVVFIFWLISEVVYYFTLNKYIFAYVFLAIIYFTFNYIEYGFTSVIIISLSYNWNLNLSNKINGKIFYIFYPSHFLVLYILSLII